MRVLVCPDSFKGTLTADEAADAIEQGWLDARPEDSITMLGLGDGGDGTAKAVALAVGGDLRTAMVAGPLGSLIAAEWVELPHQAGALIEMASASGLNLIPRDQRNPEQTTTRGTGQLIRDALDRGHRHLRIGIGGSATNDGGAGMLQDLGGRFYDASGAVITEAMTGGMLAKVERIDLATLDPRLSECAIEVACDVDNPLLGPEGASAVFGPQKGADPEMVARLDANLARFVDLAGEAGIDPALASTPGAGAAGGMGWALTAFCGGRLVSGIDLVLDLVGFDQSLAEADLVITGEGSMDAQTLRGKVVAGVLQRARRASVPVVIVAGKIADDLRGAPPPGIVAMHAVLDHAPDEAKATEHGKASDWLRTTAQAAATKARP